MTRHTSSYGLVSSYLKYTPFIKRIKQEISI